MRASFIVALIAASVASASSLYPRQNLPDCAFTCLGQGDLGGCSLTDNTCLCKNNNYIMATSACIQKACTNPQDLQNAINASVALCRSAGVDISTLTGGAPAATGSASAAATSSHSQAASSSSAAPAAQSPNAASINSVAKGAVAGFVGAAAIALAL